MCTARNVAMGHLFIGSAKRVAEGCDTSMTHQALKGLKLRGKVLLSGASRWL
jgi:hypothetical protein